MKKKAAKSKIKEKLNFKKLILAVIISVAAGVIGSLVTSPSILTWYATLNKTILTPPNWVFAPVWTTLYILIGIALYLVWDKGFNKPEVKHGIMLFFIQLVLNSAWSMIFFGFHQLLLAFFEIIILWIFIAMTMYVFKKVDKRAYYLLVPYILWVTFAAVLNLATWLANM